MIDKLAKKVPGPYVEERLRHGKFVVWFFWENFFSVRTREFWIVNERKKLKTQNKLNPSPAKNYDVRNQFLGKLFDNGF